MDKGSYYKYKTKAWFKKQGYKCEYLERYITIPDTKWNKAHPKSQPKFMKIKQDLFACDGLSMNGEHIIFWNSVLSKKNVAIHVKRFLQEPFPFAPGLIDVWVIIWIKGAGNPEIKEVGFYRE